MSIEFSNALELVNLNATAVEGLDDSELEKLTKTMRRVTQSIHHPDHGGDPAISAEANEAAALLDSTEAQRLFADRLQEQCSFETEIEAHKIYERLLHDEIIQARSGAADYLRERLFPERPPSDDHPRLFNSLPCEIEIIDAVGAARARIARGKQGDDERVREAQRRFAEQGLELHDGNLSLESDAILHEEFMLHYRVDTDCRVAVGSGEERLPHKRIVGTISSPKFFNLITFADYIKGTFRVIPKRVEQFIDIPETTAATRAYRVFTMASPLELSEYSTEQLEGVDFEPGKLTGKQFGWIAQKLSTRLKLRDHLLSWNTPPGEEPYLQLEGTVQRMRRLEQTEEAK